MVEFALRTGGLNDHGETPVGRVVALEQIDEVGRGGAVDEVEGVCEQVERLGAQAGEGKFARPEAGVLELFAPETGQARLGGAKFG